MIENSIVLARVGYPLVINYSAIQDVGQGRIQLALRSFRCRVAAGGARDTLRCKHTRRVRKVETEMFVPLTASSRYGEKEKPRQGLLPRTQRVNHNGSPQ
jgi:hypothetical protein